LSDLAKYSMTRSVARSLCDSWASCLHIQSTRIETSKQAPIFTILVFFRIPQYSDGDPPGVKSRWVWKKLFRPIFRFISEMLQCRANKAK